MLASGGGGRGFSRLCAPELGWAEGPRLPPRLNGGGGGGAELAGFAELLAADCLETSDRVGRWFRGCSGGEKRPPSPRLEPSASE